MKSHTTAGFRQAFSGLPKSVQNRLAKRIGSFNRTRSIRVFDSSECATSGIFIQLESIVNTVQLVFWMEKKSFGSGLDLTKNTSE